VGRSSSLFERLDCKPTELVDLTEAFTKRMIVGYSDSQFADACYLDFSVLDDLLDDDCEDGYYLEVVIQESDVEVSTKLTD